jgi:hypothetical protein
VVEIHSFGSGDTPPERIILRGNVKEGKAVACDQESAEDREGAAAVPDGGTTG